MGCQFKQGGGLYTRLRVGAVLLAAGEGQRMGGVAKSLIRLQGVPLINRQLVALSGAGVDEVVVVTGHARDAVEAAVAGFPVTLAHNEHYRDGQQGSVRAGLDKLGARCDAVLVLLADQPLIGAADLTELIAAFKKRGTGHVVVPVVAVNLPEPVALFPDAAARQVQVSVRSDGAGAQGDLESKLRIEALRTQLNADDLAAAQHAAQAFHALPYDVAANTL